MMYLVYTAMLALNVSAEVLNGFKTVGDAMDKSNFSVGQKIVDSYEQFDRAHENNPEKTAVQYQKAQEVRKLSKELKYYLDTLSYGLICYTQDKAEIKDHETGAKSTVTLRLGANDDASQYLIDTVKNVVRKYGLEIIAKPDNNNDGTRYFFEGTEDNPSPTCRVMTMKQRIIDYKHKLKEILGEDSSNIQIALNVEGEYWSEHAKKMVSWEHLNFDNTIIIADVVVMSRLRSEVMTAEYDAIKMLYNQITADDFKFDKVNTLVRPKTSLVIQGGKYEAQIGIGAFDSRAEFRAVINGQSYVSGEDGLVNYSTMCNAPGEKKITGTLYVKKDNNEEEYPFTESYFVMEPIAVVSLSKMNVVYSGVDNPVSISVPGVAAKDVEATIRAGGAGGKTAGAATISRDPQGKASDWIIRPSKQGRITVVVAAKTDGKVSREMGTMEIRVKKIPEPVIMLGEYKSGSSVMKGEFSALKLRLVMPDFDFQLPTPLKISQFEFQVQGSGKMGQTINGSQLNPECLSMINSARKGQKVYIDNVMVKTPDGVQHNINAMFRIK
ncbi:MAG: hypothetical protein J6X62_03820 [Bacteroidales bacterium]|nr:hypothetical protein [Bacteroidales bacterium]